MCGIAGIVDRQRRAASERVVRRMTTSLRHRGPDGDGVWTDDGVGLGHRRLAVLDLTDHGRQPMTSADGRLTITYNGEVFNFLELRRDLERLGYTFRSRTDTEVILNAYDAWGDACVARFNGMFAFAVYDLERRRLFLARDRYGVKPLYYTMQNGALLFASEIKALLEHPYVSVDVSLPALNEYFTFQNTFTDLTLFDGIFLLPPAYTLAFERNGAVVKTRYWDYDFRDEDGPSEEAYLEEFSRLFEQAVERQLVSDVELGSYLSGGIDSSSVTCIASRRFDHLKTFTCGFDLSSASGLELAFDERQKAEALSYLYKTEHYQVVLKAGDMERVMSNLIWHLEDLRVGQSYPNYYVARLASKFVKVVLSGTGGDELFAGYPWRYYRAVVNDDSDHYLDKYYRYWQRLIPDRLKVRFFQPNVYSEIAGSPSEEVFKKVINGKARTVRTPADYVNKSLYFEAKTFLRGLLLVEDKLSMAHGLETRVPFLDNDLVDFAMKVPVRYNLANLQNVVRLNENEPGWKTQRYFEKTNDGKLLARRALSRYVPTEYAHGKKQGFSGPDGSWFKGESIEYIKNMLFSNDALLYNFIQPDTARELMNDHFSGTTNRRLLIWSFLCFEWWCRIFLDPAGRRVRPAGHSEESDAVGDLAYLAA